MDFEDRLSILRSRLFGKRDLWRAAKVGDVHAIERLAREGGDIDKKKTSLNLEGVTPLYLAVEYQQLDAVKTLIRLGANVNAKDNYGMSPLMCAATTDEAVELLTLLIGAGAKINDQDKEGKSALDWAAFYGNVDAINLLLDNGANPNVVYGDRVSAPVAWAVMEEHSGTLESIKALLARGANVDTPCVGVPALHTTALYGKLAFVKVLLDAGANPNSRDKSQYTALVCAATRKHLEVVKMLLERGSDVNAVNDIGESALDRAYEGTVNLQIIKVIEAAGGKRGSDISKGK